MFFVFKVDQDGYTLNWIFCFDETYCFLLEANDLKDLHLNNRSSVKLAKVDCRLIANDTGASITLLPLLE